MVELLSTKLFIPRPRPNLVSRPRLTERLNAGLDKQLTLIAAPAGFGKTTLLSEWIPKSPRCVTWLSLDEGDNDSTQFWTYFISSLQGLRADLGSGELTLLQSPQALPITSILTALINDVTAFSDAFAFVLDDYHVIESQPIHEALTFLLSHLPANMHLVITSRVDPPLPLARLRASDQLTELRANDLRFTADEAAAFLSQVMGFSLSAEEIATLEARTEGWIAGLQIAALSMRGHDDVSGFIQAFSGSHRHILGYLAEEVLSQRPKGTLNFLLQTSILERLCGSLCDAVTGETGGQTILENLELANLFISPLDDERIWYRYHHLFAEVLGHRLRQAYATHVPELHRRAGRWYASQGMIDEAMRHALAGEDYEKAAHLIEIVAGNMLRQGSSSSLIRWLDAMPDEIVRTHPRLCLARGWASLWGPVFSHESADRWAQLALQEIAPGLDLESDLIGEVFALRALIAADKVELPLSRELSHRALDYLSADSPWLGVTTFCLGAALYAAGEFSTASPVLTEALRLSQADSALYIQLIAGSFLGDIQVFQGHLGRAKEMYQQVLEWGDHGVPQKGALIAHAGLANVLCEQDQLEAALFHVHLGIDQLEQVGGPGAALWLNRTLARVQRAMGNRVDALEALDRAYQSGQNAQIPFVMQQAAALRARVLLAQGDLEAATAWATDSGLDPEDAQVNQAGLRDVEYLTLARVLSAQGLHMEALTLLERLLNSSLAEERGGSVIEILVLQSLVFRTQGHATRSMECLERALILGEPEGYVRTFVDEGEPMHQLLINYQSMIKKRMIVGAESKPFALLTYTDKLLAAFSLLTPIKSAWHGSILEPLSERELDILRLIATGRSNQEIAEILVIAVSTVKSHINHLYGKLGTNRRTQAIAIARNLGLLQD
jgi:LuxR family maltose regulon positive regulatory protein